MSSNLKPARRLQQRYGLGVLCWLLWAPPAFAQDTLRVGYFSLPPHVASVQKGTQSVASGPAVDYLQAVAQQMGVTLQLEAQAMPLDRLLHELRNGNLDLAVALARTSEREAFVRFPAKAFYQMQPAIAVRANSPLQAVHTQSDLFGLKIGAYSQGYLSPLMRHPQVTREILYGDKVTSRSLTMLTLGRIDAAYSPDRQALVSAAGTLGILGQVRIIGLPDAATGLYTAFSARLDPAMVQRYVSALNTLPPYEAIWLAKP